MAGALSLAHEKPQPYQPIVTRRRKGRRRARSHYEDLPPALSVARQLPEVLAQRDISYIRRAYPIVSKMTDYYYRSEVSGTEHLSRGPSLVVATHNGGMATPDLYCLMVAFWRTSFARPSPGLSEGAKIQTHCGARIASWVLRKV